LPRAQLVEVQNRLTALKPCFSLTKTDLDTNPVCPHCQFRPVAEPSAAATAASQILAAVDGDLDRMHDEWTRTLLDNLADPTVKRSMDALAVKHSKVVESFIDKKELPETLDNDFVTVLHQVFQGLEKVTLPVSEIAKALTEGGTPCTIPELKGRFEK